MRRTTSKLLFLLLILIQQSAFVCNNIYLYVSYYNLRGKYPNSFKRKEKFNTRYNIKLLSSLIYKLIISDIFIEHRFLF